MDAGLELELLGDGLEGLTEETLPLPENVTAQERKLLAETAKEMETPPEWYELPSAMRVALKLLVAAAACGIKLSASRLNRLTGHARQFRPSLLPPAALRKAREMIKAATWYRMAGMVAEATDTLHQAMSGDGWGPADVGVMQLRAKVARDILKKVEEASEEEEQRGRDLSEVRVLIEQVKGRKDLQDAISRVAVVWSAGADAVSESSGASGVLEQGTVEDGPALGPAKPEASGDDGWGD